MTQNTITRDYSKAKTLTKAVLLTLGMGAVLLTMLFAPNAIQIFKPFLKKKQRSNYDRERIRQAVHALEHRGLIRRFRKGKEVFVRVTKEGRKYVKNHEIKNLKFPVASWDKKWRLILFDIPEFKGGERRAFQTSLKNLGCYILQKSVLVYPHPCRQELEFLATFLDVNDHICYIETDSLGDSETAVRKFFGL